LEPPPSGSKADSQHPLRLLTSSLTEPYAPEFTSITPDEETSNITLSRTIFEWADQNVRPSATKDQAGNNAAALPSQNNAQPKTLSVLDQFHINPFVAQQKLPSMLLIDRAAPSNMQPIQMPPLPLSRILNAPPSLPPPADLISGLEAEARIET
jgi:hypothetical protein